MLDSSNTIILAYGSLLNKTSREEHNNIKVSGMPVIVRGWERGWLTRSFSEQQTYVGAKRNSTTSLTALAIPSHIDESLLEREKDYRFTEVSSKQVSYTNGEMIDCEPSFERKKFYICETLEEHPPNLEYPIHQSYIDTCLAGALEANGETWLTAFLKTTSTWPSKFIVNDRKNPMYPRSAPVAEEQLSIIDEIIGGL